MLNVHDFEDPVYVMRLYISMEERLTALETAEALKLSYNKNKDALSASEDYERLEK
jgi:hypothetical protein